MVKLLGSSGRKAQAAPMNLNIFTLVRRALIDDAAASVAWNFQRGNLHEISHAVNQLKL